MESMLRQEERINKLFEKQILHPIEVTLAQFTIELIIHRRLVIRGLSRPASSLCIKKMLREIS